MYGELDHVNQDLVGVLYPEDALSPVGGGKEVVEQRRSSASEVQEACGARSKTHSNTHTLSGLLRMR